MMTSLRDLLRLASSRPVMGVCCAALCLLWFISVSDTGAHKDVPVHKGAVALEEIQDHLRGQPRPEVSNIEIYDIRKHMESKIKCVYMRIDPPTPVCLHDTWRDVYISHDLEDTGLWEPHVLKDFIEVLIRDPRLGVVDIGANVGVYSLVAANMGRRAVAIEPFQEHIYRIHQAAQNGHLQNRIIVLHNAISDRRVKATLKLHGTNQGDTRIRHGAEPCIGSCLPTVYTILLDDVMEVMTFNHTVIKIDSQGFEHRTFMRAERFLSEMSVPYIFMEWQLMKEHYVAQNYTSEDKTLVDTMVNYLFQKKFRPYSLDTMGATALDPRRWHTWPHDIIWRRLPTDKEYTRILRNHFLIWP